MRVPNSVRLGWAKRVATVAAVSQALSRRDGHKVHGPDAVEFTRFAQKSSMRFESCKVCAT